VLQADGKIVVVGESGTDFNTGFALARYNVNGTLDPSFGSGGKVLTHNGAVAFAVVAEPDGKLLVAGIGGYSSNISLARYNVDGSLDVTFGNGGLVTTLENPLNAPAALALEPDGKLVVAWASIAIPAVQYSSTTSSFSLARYNADGTLDASFGSSGRVDTSLGDGYDLATGVAIQADGKILVVGTGDAGSGPSTPGLYGVEPLFGPGNNNPSHFLLSATRTMAPLIQPSAAAARPSRTSPAASMSTRALPWKAMARLSWRGARPPLASRISQFPVTTPTAARTSPLAPWAGPPRRLARAWISAIACSSSPTARLLWPAGPKSTGLDLASYLPWCAICRTLP